MNLYFRLLLVILKAMRSETITPDALKNNIKVRMMPNDLDINMHVTNGRYLTLCDLARVDFFVRSGLAALMIKNKWSPIVAEHTMTYLRPIKVFEKIDIHMEITHLDEKYVHCSHHFYKGENLMAQGTSKALIISKTGSLSPQYTLDKVVEYQASKNPQAT